LDAPRDAASITFLSVLNINSNNYLFFHLNNVIFIFQYFLEIQLINQFVLTKTLSENHMPGNKNKRKHFIILTHTSAFFNCQSQNSVKHTLLVNFLNVLHIWFCLNYNPVLSPFLIRGQVCNKSNTTGVSNGTGIAHLSRVPCFCGFIVGQSLGFSVMFCSVDRRLSFVFWLLYCRSVFDIQLMIITLVYSNIINLTVHPGLLHISTQTRMRA
jgi:hypothetical protein